MLRSRREFLLHGLAGVAASTVLPADLWSDDTAVPAVGAAHHAAKAKRCVWLFMGGGPSHIETFDPKPDVTKHHGKSINEFVTLPDVTRDAGNKILAPKWAFKNYGKSGLPVSDLLPEMGSCADDLCVVRSVCCDAIDHKAAIHQMTTGDRIFRRPSLGSWLSYGLGPSSDNLPSFVAIAQKFSQGTLAPFQAGFLPATNQGTWVRDLRKPIDYISGPAKAEVQRKQLDLAQALNALHMQERQEDSRLDAKRLANEMAYRMQSSAADAFDIEKESKETKALYGLDNKTTATYGRQCLMARRLLERGVRYVYVDCGNEWDAHSNLTKAHPSIARRVDKPCAALIKDLKRRGMLDDTLVIWGGEFGRTPVAQGGDGREHHPHAFSMVFAGGGVKGGHLHGATDELGYYVAEDRMHVNDFHATILHLMGIDHERLTYRFSGRDYRLTDVAGKVHRGIIA